MIGYCRLCAMNSADIGKNNTHCESAVSQQIRIVEANLNNSAHAVAVLDLLDHYARDAMGGGAPLSDESKQNLLPCLRQRSDLLVILAFAGDVAAGLIIAFEGFSTFACRPLLNLHDVAVRADFRRRGIARLMLQKAASIARQRGYCKLTLEVLEGNRVAQAAYRQQGFAAYQLNPAAGQALFWEKLL